MDAAAIARALGGRKAGGGWTARCPSHDDRRPSLSIGDKDGKVLVRCHAGCSQADVVAALRGRGLWSGRGAIETSSSGRTKSATPVPAPDDTARIRAALAIWQAATPAPSSPVARYLASRGIHERLPDALRYHGALRHPTGGCWQAMVALVTDGRDGTPVAIHRTFLAADGTAKAPVEPAKMMLGPCRGGAVRLADAGATLMVGEGIETCLAAMQATGRPAWAALSTSGLRTLDLPATVRDVIVLADGDDAGEAAAGDCAWRWSREGRRVRIARPPRGLDFNDLLQGQRAGFEVAP